MKLLCIMGTRPEAIKLAPIVLQSKKTLDINIEICLTGQHTDLVHPILEFFNLKSNYELIIDRNFDTLNEILAQSINNFSKEKIFDSYHGVIVQGDTTSALSAALATFNIGKPIFHVEAGLRTYNFKDPFPEEMNRVLISKLATLFKLQFVIKLLPKIFSKAPTSSPSDLLICTFSAFLYSPLDNNLSSKSLFILDLTKLFFISDIFNV